MKKDQLRSFVSRYHRSVSLTLLTGVILFAPYGITSIHLNEGVFKKQVADASTTARPVTSPFIYTFNSPGVLDESGSMNETWSPYFWLNSGGKFIIKNGVGETAQGPLPSSDYWRELYGKTNALDTGNGYYPQNLFRLITRSRWDNVIEQLRFKITHINLTDTPNRDGYSGVLLFSHYQDEYNLYYAGIRMDGTAVIKKKVGGVYYTLAQTPIWKNGRDYNKYTNPNLIPENRWMGLKLETKDNADGTVSLTLWLDQTDTGAWHQVLAVKDSQSSTGAPTVRGAAYAGIRTDYANVQFDQYRLTKI